MAPGNWVWNLSFSSMLPWIFWWCPVDKHLINSYFIIPTLNVSNMYIVILHSFNFPFPFFGYFHYPNSSPSSSSAFLAGDEAKPLATSPVLQERKCYKTKGCDLLGTVCCRKFAQLCGLFSTIQTEDMNSLILIHHFNAHCQRFRRCEQFFLGWRLSKAEKTEMLFGMLLIFFNGCLFPFFLSAFLFLCLLACFRFVCLGFNTITHH